MFIGSSHRPQQHTHSPNTSGPGVVQVVQNVWPGRHMGPPQLNHPPQPVEIDPVSYHRAPSSYTPWEGAAYSIGFMGEPSPSAPSSTGLIKSGPLSVDYGARQDPLANWITGNDGPWIPKGAVPEVSQDERMHHRGYTPYRNSGFGSPPGIRQRPGNPSDIGSVNYGIPPSDSGYGTGISLESSSVRGSDSADHSQDSRSLLGRVTEIHQYRERRSPRESHRTNQWPYSSPSAMLIRCQTCQKQVKTKSELKKHHLRHTKPFRCTNLSCSRAEGFSTVNDLNRHKQSKHPGDLSGEIRLKTYHCLVLGCKSHDKVWPRLDNFKSHLKRMHRLPEDAMDQFVHRGEMDHQTKGNLPSQGDSSASPGRLDQDIPLSLGSDDFPELSYPNDNPQWSSVSSSPLNRQTEITDPLFENADAQPLVPPNLGSLIDLENDQGETISPIGSRALWQSGARPGCLEKDKKLMSTDVDSEGTAMPISKSLGSSMSTLKSSDTPEKGKTPRLKKSPPIDPSLRDALITAVFSTMDAGTVARSYPAVRSLPGIGPLGATHVSEISPCPMDSGTALPTQVPISGGHVDDPDLLLKASSDSAADTRDLADQDAKIQKILQALKDVGYVLKKDNKLQIGLGQTFNNLASGVHKKRDPVKCSRCKFHGRPSELKKHMKRHTRPYGCTYPKCQKTFGSKNDWKRHETSQHYQDETWRCDEKINDTACTKVFFSADIARAHLTKMHKVTDPEAVERKITERRIGADNQARFWCGFCEKTIDQAQKGVDAWNERFNHIDDHFMGKNNQARQSIAEWKSANGDSDVAPQNVSAQPQSTMEGDEASESSLPSSSDTLTSSPRTPIVPPSMDSSPGKQKRKRGDNDDRSGRPKVARHGIYEPRIECCQCGFNLNPRIETACPSDGHDICGQCQKGKVMVQEDTAE